MTTKAKPKKLRDGTWGAVVERMGIGRGDVIQVTTAAGKTWQAAVERVVWSGDGVTICATRSLDRPERHGGQNGDGSERLGSGSGRGTWTGCRCGSVEEYERPGDCRSCQHDR